MRDGPAAGAPDGMKKNLILSVVHKLPFQAVKPFLQTDRLSDSERAMLMGGACAKAYGWSPTKA